MACGRFSPRGRRRRSFRKCRLARTCTNSYSTNATMPSIRGSSTFGCEGSRGTNMSIIAKGLDGVVVDNTSVSEVTSETSSLVYRGYRAQELAEQCAFDEVAYLLWNGDLPNRAQLDEFQKSERQLRTLDPALLEALKHVPKQAHPMDVVRTGVSWLGMEEPDSLHLN